MFATGLRLLRPPYLSHQQRPFLALGDAGFSSVFAGLMSIGCRFLPKFFPPLASRPLCHFAVVLSSLQEHGLDAAPQVIVVDGGSSDNTVTIAKEMGAKVTWVVPSALQ